MNIHELDSYDLGDAVKFNSKLNPRIWGADEKMRPEVREQLLRIADDFREFLGIDVELKDITVSGSNAAYTYTPHSDIDLHLVVDLPQADANEVYRELFDAKKYAYNDQHDIRIGGYDVELYVQDANKKHISQGIYSVMNNDWVSVPKRRRPDVDDISIRSKFEDLGHRIESAVASGNYEKISALAQRIKDLRQAGLDAHGEFGPENLAFKVLRKQGLIEKLYNARNAAKDELLSLDERKKKRKKKVRYGYGGYWYPGTAYAGQDHPAGTEGSDGGGDGGGESVREDVGMTWDGVSPTTDMFTSEDATMTWDGVNPSTAMFTTETQDKTDEEILREFIKFCVAELKIERMPRVKLRKDPEWPKRNKTFGRYQDDGETLEVAWGNRHIMDVLRTVAHELTHKRQHEREDVPASAGETGSEYENEANARAGILMRDWARLHPEHFDAGQAAGLEESASGYIPTRAQARDPRFSMALTVDIKPGQVGKEANKLKLKTDKQGHPQIARANGLFENLYREYKKYKADEDYSPDNPPGPEFKPSMPAGTLRVDVSDVYDWYKLGQHISNMKGLGKHDFGAGPPSSIISFGDEDTEHKFINDLKATGLDVTDIDPADPKKRPGKKIKTDPTYNVNEDEDLDEVKMSPGALEKFAASDAAKGIRAGFEAELIFRDTQGESDEMDPEPNYDADERAYSIQQVIEFFDNDEYGFGLSNRQRNTLENELDEAYMTWRDEQIMKDFADEAEDLVRKVIEDEEWDWDDAVRNQLDDMGLSNDEIEAAMDAGQKAPRFTKLSDQDDYIKQNAAYDNYLKAYNAAESILDDLVEESVAQQDGYWDQALDDYRDDYAGDDDSFFEDVGLRWMSDIANNYDLDWPVWNMDPAGVNEGSRDWEEIGDSLHNVVGMPVKVSSGYHSTTRKEGQWIIEPDSSLSPDDPSDETGLEIVSPPMPLLMAIEKLKAVVDWANDPQGGNAYTNSSTGLHMGVSLPIRGGDVDYVKLILFMGDKYVLEQFGREANNYTASAMEKLLQNIRGKRSDPAGVIKLLQHGLTELAYKELQKGVGTSKYTSAHIKDGYIEFRSPGGDWLSAGDRDIAILENTMMRFAQAMAIAGDPSAERQEYAKKLYKLVTTDNEQYADQLRLFSEYSAGTINKEQLKKQWAQQTLAKDAPEVTQKGDWVVINTATGKPVQGQSYNGYTKDEVRNRAKQKLSPAASDTDFDLSYSIEPQNTGRWEIYSFDPNDDTAEKTLEIVDGPNRGAAADAVYDKYNAQGIAFKVRPWYGQADKQPEPKLTPRAKLAKRIVQPKPQVEPKQVQARASNGVPYWNIVDRDTSNVVHTVADHDRMTAYRQGMTWLRSMGAEPGYEDRFGVEPKMIPDPKTTDAKKDSADLQRTLGIQDVEPNVAQNFEPHRQNWELVSSEDPDRVVHRMPNATTEEVRAWIAQQEQGGMPPGFLRTRIVAEAKKLFQSRIGQVINQVEENFADGKVKGKSRPGRVKRAGASCNGSVTDLRRRAKNSSGEKAKMYHWCANMKSGRKK